MKPSAIIIIALVSLRLNATILPAIHNEPYTFKGTIHKEKLNPRGQLVKETHQLTWNMLTGSYIDSNLRTKITTCLTDGVYKTYDAERNTLSIEIRNSTPVSTSSAFLYESYSADFNSLIKRLSESEIKIDESGGEAVASINHVHYRFSKNPRRLLSFEYQPGDGSSTIIKFGKFSTKGNVTLPLSTSFKITAKSGKVQVDETYTICEDGLEINPPVFNDTYSPKIQIGTRVTDLIKKTTYIECGLDDNLTADHISAKLKILAQELNVKDEPRYKP